MKLDQIRGRAQGRSRIGILFAVALLLAACAPAATPTPTAAPKVTLTVSGSGSITSMIKALSEAYNKNHSDLAFEFLPGSGTGGGVKAIGQGTLDLAAMARAATADEAASGVVFVPLTMDKVVFATHASLPALKLTSQQIKDVLTGKITHWSAVGGPDAPINLLVRDEGDSSTQLLREKLGKDAFAGTALVLTSAGDMNKALSDTSNAFGFLAQSSFAFDKPKVKLIVVDGHDPSDVKDEAYPYMRAVGAGYMKANASKVKPFVDYLSSLEAKTLLSSQGLAPAK